MPYLQDLNLSAVTGTPEEKIDSIVKQINDAFRLISNEKKTLIIKGDQTTEAITIGELGDDRYGILMNDGTNDRLIIGRDDGGF